jgi:hypothetical protein
MGLICQKTGQKCVQQNMCWPFHGCAPEQAPYLAPVPSPRFLPVNIPFPMIGITVVTLDGNGNVTIKVNQPCPSGTDQ